MTTNNNPKQTIWEIWFTSSITILLIIIFIGTVIDYLPEHQIYITLLIISFINALCAIIVGLRDDD